MRPIEFLSVGGNVDKAAFWRFPDGTHFSYKGRTYRKDSFCSAQYLDKLHGVTIEYFCPLKRFTFVNPEKGFKGTLLDEEQMYAVIHERRGDYLDILYARAKAELELHEYGATPWVPEPLLVEPKDTWPALLFAITRAAIKLPRQFVLYGYVATVERWAKERKHFRARWKDAQWDFWNQPARSLNGYIPWKPK